MSGEILSTPRSARSQLLAGLRTAPHASNSVASPYSSFYRSKPPTPLDFGFDQFPPSPGLAYNSTMSSVSNSPAFSNTPGSITAFPGPSVCTPDQLLVPSHMTLSPDETMDPSYAARLLATEAYLVQRQRQLQAQILQLTTQQFSNMNVNAQPYSIPNISSANSYPCSTVYAPPSVPAGYSSMAQEIPGQPGLFLVYGNMNQKQSYPFYPNVSSQLHVSSSPPSDPNASLNRTANTISGDDSGAQANKKTMASAPTANSRQKCAGNKTSGTSVSGLGGCTNTPGYLSPPTHADSPPSVSAHSLSSWAPRCNSPSSNSSHSIIVPPSSNNPPSSRRRTNVKKPASLGLGDSQGSKSAFSLRSAGYPGTPLTGTFGPGQARAGEHAVRQPRGPPSLEELLASPTAKCGGSKNFAVRQRRQAVNSLVKAVLEGRGRRLSPSGSRSEPVSPPSLSEFISSVVNGGSDYESESPSSLTRSSTSSQA